MRLFRVAAISLFAALIVGAGTAEAAGWYLPLRLAKHETKRFAISDCESDFECVAYGVGPCARRTPSRVDCLESTYFSDPEGEMRCDVVLHWGVNFRGVVTLKNTGHADCYYQ